MTAIPNEQNEPTLEAIRRLSRVIIHDLNNPLSALSGYMQLAQMRMEKLQQGDTSVVGDLAEFLGKIDQATERINSLVQRLDKFSKILPAPAQSVNLEKMWNHLVSSRDSEEQQRISLEISEPDLVIRTHPQCFEQVAAELLDNACWATREENSGEVIIKNSMEEGNRFVLEIQDNGCGIDEDMLEKLDIPCYFNRENRGFPKQGLLTGIGLPIVYHLVDYLEGEIEIESRPGEGTKVQVRIPVE
jgi:signal transduction histidine kinase